MKKSTLNELKLPVFSPAGKMVKKQVWVLNMCLHFQALLPPGYRNFQAQEESLTFYSFIPQIFIEHLWKAHHWVRPLVVWQWMKQTEVPALEDRTFLWEKTDKIKTWN